MICKRKIGFILFLTCAAAVGFLQPFRALAPQSHMVMAVTLISLGAWIFKGKNTPYTAGAVVFIAGCLTCRLPLATLTSAYTGSAIWILIPALFFGFALLKTGLGTRIAYFVLQALRPGYFMICLGWLIIGLVLSAMTPSITVRLSIVLPIAMSLVRACNIPEKSNASALISFSAWAAALLPGIAWQTGSLWGIIIPGFYPPEMRSFASPGTWFQYMSVPWFSITFIFLALIYLLFRPGTGLVIDPKIIKEKYRSLGRIKVDEIVCCCVLVCSLILFS
ncbi:MAG TPA: anion permease, partial [Syntrophorhabdaceae bacterium]|nr:anion permease [Syntrophorhabdaceae bacterium]